MSNELSDASSGSQVPKSHGLIPGGGDDEGVVVGDGEISHEMGVTSQALEGNSDLIVFGLLESPDDKVLISGSGDEDSIFVIGGVSVPSDDGGDVVFVSDRKSVV